MFIKKMDGLGFFFYSSNESETEAMTCEHIKCSCLVSKYVPETILVAEDGDMTSLDGDPETGAILFPSWSCKKRDCMRMTTSHTSIYE